MGNKYVNSSQSLEVLDSKTSFKGNSVVKKNKILMSDGKRLSGKEIEKSVKINTKLNFETEIVNGKETFVSGCNLKNKAIRRGYLKHDEMGKLMTLTSVIHLVEGLRDYGHASSEPMWDSWFERKMITKEQKKTLKTAITYLSNFINSVFNDNLDLTSKTMISDRLADYDFRLVDDYTVKKLYNMIQTKDIHLHKEEFFNLVEDKMNCECRNCNKDRNDCEVRIFFENYFVPPINENLDNCNCEFAYTDEDLGRKNE